MNKVGSALIKELGPFAVFSIAAGAMISSGLFVLPGQAFAVGGPSIVFSYALAGLLMAPVTLSKIELATAMPKSGGSYFYIGRSLGPMAGTVAGIGNWLSIILKSAFALIGIGAMLTNWIEGINDQQIKYIALVAAVIFTALNLVSTKHTGRLQIVLVMAMIVILGAYILRATPSIEGERLFPFVSYGWRNTLLATGMVFISFGGLTKAVDVSEEVRDPARNIPLGLISAFLVVTILYVVVVFVTVGVVPAEELSGSFVPISLGARNTMGNVGPILIDLAAFFAFITTANAGILSAARSPMAMSRDGLLPERLSDTSKRFNTPHWSILLTAAVLTVLIAFLSIENLIKSASAVLLAIFVLDNLSVIIMRQSGIQNYRPSFRVPLYPWLQIAASIVYGVLILQMGLVPLLITCGFVMGALGWYFGYVGRRIMYESAFIHMVKRIVAKSIVRSDLEDELRHITLERYDVTHDRFDELLHHCAVIDLSGPLGARDAFKLISEALAKRNNMDPKHLYELFLAREKESSTVVQPGLAIPHVVVEGENVFDLLLLRSRAGITYSDLNQPVTTAFVLIGSSDERNFHLKALMHIAHIVQEPEFAARWDSATSAEALRDVVLLSTRPRH